MKRKSSTVSIIIGVIILVAIALAASRMGKKAVGPEPAAGQEISPVVD
jgi:hypothetical protein